MNIQKGCPDPQVYESLFHNMFTAAIDGNRRNLSSRFLVINDEPPSLLGNPSQFCVFSTVRSAILGRWSSLLFSQPVVDDSDVEDRMFPTTMPGVDLPKLVETGLKVLFTLIQDSGNSHPEVTRIALKSMMNILQGYGPEELSTEPPIAMGDMLSMLMGVCCGPGPPPGDLDDGSHISAMACSCIAALIVATGDNTQILEAICMMLASPEPLANQNVLITENLITHQKLVQALVVGSAHTPNWMTCGVPEETLISEFKIHSSEYLGAEATFSVACDGCYLYVATNKTLLKVGTGHGNTVQSYLYYVNCYPFRDIKKYKDCGRVNLMCHKNKLLATIASRRGIIFELDKQTLMAMSEMPYDVPLTARNIVVFATSSHIGYIIPTQEDGLVLKLCSLESDPETNRSTLVIYKKIALNLTKTYTYVLGSSAYEDVSSQKILEPLESSQGDFDESATIAAGQEFTLIRTKSGKVYFNGKASALGQKNPVKSVRWSELALTRGHLITQMAVGHEGQHAVLLTHDGQALFTGTARRGEDGDTPKARRQTKSIKNKRFSKLENDIITHAACNYGSSALVTKQGDLYMFGKDTQHCDQTGQVKALRNEFITKVALGKAHGVALNSDGNVFTYGINNRGQCGRDWSNVKSFDSASTTSDHVKMCTPGKHKWKQDLCMICTKCLQCTGFSENCKSTTKKQPKQICGCGEGDSGCEVCGVCRICVDEPIQETTSKASSSKSTAESSSHNAKYSEHCRKQKRGSNISSQSGVYKRKYASRQLKFGSPSHASKMNEDCSFSEAERDSSNRVSCLPPLPLLFNKKVVDIACGLHHTVMLTDSGEVYTFGSNQFLQLGSHSANPGIVKISCPRAKQIAAGSNHTVILTCSGEVYTLGANNKGQLGKKDAIFSSTEISPIMNLGPANGSKAKWVGASGDQTFIKVDHVLVNMKSLLNSTITGTDSTIIVLPSKEEECFKCLTINTWNGTCLSFESEEQANLVKSVVCMDPLYETLWQFSPRQTSIRNYNILIYKAKNLHQCSTEVPLSDVAVVGPSEDGKPADNDVLVQKSINIFTRELALPKIPNSFVSRSQIALHLLASLDVAFTQSQRRKTGGPPESYGNLVVGEFKDYSVINRFSAVKGAWAYNPSFSEAIRFCCSSNILLGGFGLFGGRGEYTGRIKLFDGTEEDVEGEILAESLEVPYDCAPKEIHFIFFQKPAKIIANRWYIAWAHVTGPSSDGGSGGVTSVTSSDGVTFKFKSTSLSNNATDVQNGQIPCLLYKILPSVMSDIQSPICFPSHITSPSFAFIIKPKALECLYNLLFSSWHMFLKAATEQYTNMSHLLIKSKIDKLEKWCYTCKIVLRLIKNYLVEMYPVNKLKRIFLEDREEIVNKILQLRNFLIKILSYDKVPSAKNTHMRNSILCEAHETFEHLFHIFYPTSSMKWNILCSLLKDVEDGVCKKHSVILSATLASLSAHVNMKKIIPRIQISPEEKLRPKLLVRRMISATMAQINEGITSWTINDALDHLMELATTPVLLALQTDDQRKLTVHHFLSKNCCQMLTKTIAELTFHAVNPEDTKEVFVHQNVLTTPSRFLSMSSTYDWQSDKGFPDAISFRVEQPGISIVGVTVFGGIGNYKYELEILADKQSDYASPPPWKSLEYIRGCFNAELNDSVDLKFVRTIKLKENAVYAIRFWNFGGPTRSGDKGIQSVKGPDGTVFSFLRCSLSLNGTGPLRGQIPSLIYIRDATVSSTNLSFETETKIPRNQIIKMAQPIIKTSANLLQKIRNTYSASQLLEKIDIFEQSPCFKTLLPQTLAHLCLLNDPESYVAILALVKELLPDVAAINLLLKREEQEDTPRPPAMTTSSHYVWVESEHPYKPAIVTHHRVSFPSSVSYMVLEMDPKSGMSQPEDSLTLYIQLNNKKRDNPEMKLLDEVFNVAYTKVPESDWLTFYTVREKNSQYPETFKRNFIPITHKMSNMKSDWPVASIIVPGNEVVFVMETASDYLKDDCGNRYGFKCLAIGYEDLAEAPSRSSSSQHGVMTKLEMELSHLGGMCAAALMSPSIYIIPHLEGFSTAEEEESIISFAEGENEIVSRGLALSHPPTIQEALSGQLSYKCSNERLFLQDFINASGNTAGGRLANWLLSESYVDVRHCRLMPPTGVPRCGETVKVPLVLRDQHGKVVRAPGLQLGVTASLLDGPAGILNSNHPVDWPYQVTVKDNMRFHCITMMRAYQMHSFEELRASTPLFNVPPEVLQIDSSGESISASWIPQYPGRYSIRGQIEGFFIGECITVDVAEPTEGAVPPNPHHVSFEPKSSRIQKFVVGDSSGLRIRTCASLQSEQIGLLQADSTIQYDEKIMNADGVWLRLCPESLLEHCGPLPADSEGWCLQYNHHVGRVLLLPSDAPGVEETELQDQNDSSHSDDDKFNGAYTVIKNAEVKTCCERNAPVIGVLQVGDFVTVQLTHTLITDTWVLLDKVTMDRYGFVSGTGKCWVLRSHLETLLNPQPGNIAGADFAELQRRVSMMGPNSFMKDSDTVRKFATQFTNFVKHLTSDHEESFCRPSQRMEHRDGRYSNRDSIRGRGGNLETAVESSEVKPRKKVVPAEAMSMGSDLPLRRRSSNLRNSQHRSSITDPIASGASQTSGPSTIDASEQMKHAKLGPYQAESLRVFFAAFLWHEGIVHDAMACASYLKYYPSLPKKGYEVMTRAGVFPNIKSTQRHSVEVSNAGHYLNIQQSTLDTLTASGIRARSKRTPCAVNPASEAMITEEDPSEPVHPPVSSEAPLGELVSVLPTAFRGILALWDALLENVRKPVDASKDNKSIQTLIQESIADDFHEKPMSSGRSERKKEPPFGRGLLPDIWKKALVSPEVKKDVIKCELCGVNVRLPFSDHMLMVHGGCGMDCDFGFNDAGNYTRGWDGTCGQQGINESNMHGYIFCGGCLILARGKVEHDSFLKELEESPSFPTEVDHPTYYINENDNTIMNNNYSFSILKKNAQFLLDLSSEADNEDENRDEATPPAPPSVPWLPLPPYQCLEAFMLSGGSQNKAHAMDKLMQDGSNLYLDQSGASAHSIQVNAMPSTSGGSSRVPRSISMGQDSQQMSSSLLLKRKKEQSGPSNSSLLGKPSAALELLVGLIPEETHSSLQNEDIIKVDMEALLSKPVMTFLTKDRNTVKLKAKMVQSLRVGALRKYGLEALNWLMHSVTQPTSLHDLMWWFNQAMNLYHLTLTREEKRCFENANIQNGNDVYGCRDSLEFLGGVMSVKLRGSLHNLLQSISDLMAILPPSSPLLLQAVRCWSLHFTPADHMFLHRSQVFSNISNILSHSEENVNDEAAAPAEDASFVPSCQDVQVWGCRDITAWCEVAVSSRPGMTEPLTDGSTETFWESGEEDRRKPKWIQITVPQHLDDQPNIMCLHVDNTRDNVNKVTLVSFYIGTNPEELQLIKEHETSVKGCGWILCSLPLGGATVVRCELCGPDPTVRIRQIRVLGQQVPAPMPQPTNLTLQRCTEVETLRVFRLITSQVFGKLIDPDFDSDNEVQKENNYLKEHMVGILFSRSKLTSLQKQVMVHIVSAIKSESQRAREIWQHSTFASSPPSESNPIDNVVETASSSKAIDDYCFEMLSMVLALSGSSIGRSYIAEQLSLIKDLLSLLHTGSARVQRQVISVLRRIIGEVSPQNMNIALDVGQNKVSFIDHLVGCISKGLKVHIKLKTVTAGAQPPWGTSSAPSFPAPPKSSVYSVSLRTSLTNPGEVQWFLRGGVSLKHAQLVAELLFDMIQGKISEAWAQTTKAAIVDNVFDLTTLREQEHAPDTCVTLPSFWRALGSLCVLDKDLAERLSVRGWKGLASGDSFENYLKNKQLLYKQVEQSRPLCVNHDDDKTFAVIECLECGTMCQECDKFLHLNRSRRHHQRRVCKEEEGSIRVDLHEGCGRVKLFWLMALVEQRSLKALVEFRGSVHKSDLAEVAWKGAAHVSTGVCRFCGAESNTGLLAIGNVCADQECQEHSKNACGSLLVCGHLCGGVSGERRCLPCLHGCAGGPAPQQQEEAAASVCSRPALRQDAEDMCMVCFTDPLTAAPAIQLECGHVFHFHCTKKILINKWVGARITFSFSQCPICKEDISHVSLEDLLKPIRELKEEVKKKALMRLEYEGRMNAAAIATRYNNVASEYAMDRYAYYVCNKCQKAYYGGEARCDASGFGGNHDFDPRDLVCGGCSDVACAQMCPKHGADFLEYKCRFCCSVAIFFCLGDTHFCNGCHEEFQRLRKIPIAQLPQCPAGSKGKQLDGTVEDCPLGVKHPATGTEFALGCGICRNSNTF